MAELEVIQNIIFPSFEKIDKTLDETVWRGGLPFLPLGYPGLGLFFWQGPFQDVTELVAGFPSAPEQFILRVFEYGEQPYGVSTFDGTVETAYFF